MNFICVFHHDLFPHDLKQPCYCYISYISRTVSASDSSRGVEREEMDNNEGRRVDFLSLTLFLFSTKRTYAVGVGGKYRRIAS